MQWRNGKKRTAIPTLMKKEEQEIESRDRSERPSRERGRSRSRPRIHVRDRSDRSRSREGPVHHVHGQRQRSKRQRSQGKDQKGKGKGKDSKNKDDAKGKQCKEPRNIDNLSEETLEWHRELCNYAQKKMSKTIVGNTKFSNIFDWSTKTRTAQGPTSAKVHSDIWTR